MHHEKLINMVFASKDLDTSSKEKPDSKYEHQKKLLFRPKRASGVKEFEGQRILQVSIRFNLAFD